MSNIFLFIFRHCAFKQLLLKIQELAGVDVPAIVELVVRNGIAAVTRFGDLTARLTAL